ncbi:MAG: carbohydrate porin [Chthoniobacteraceae bacterium]
MKPRIASTIASALALSGVMACASPSTATVSSTPTGWDEWLNGKYATGNWGGLRDRLEADGIQFFGFYTSIPAGVVSGGMRRGATYVDDWYFGVHLDLEKLIGWNGATFTVSGINRDGESLTKHYVGSNFDAQQCYGGQNVFLYGVYLEQKIANDKVTVKLGRFSASDDFNSSPLYGYSLNNAINGDIRAVLFDTQFSAYPYSTWAGSIKVQPTGETYAQLGVFQGGDRLFNSRLNGVNWDITSGDCAFVIGQVGWTPEFNKQAVPGTGDGKGKPAEMKGLPGHYWVGASYSSYEYTKFNSTTDKGTNSYGVYAHADQMVYQEGPGSDQGLTVFTAGCLYPQKEISIMPWQATLGLNYKGLIPGRDDDHTMLHAVYGRFSSVYADSVEAAGGGRPQYEAVLETGHRIALTKFAYIQPDVQLILNPAGAHRIPNAVVLGAQLGVTF